MCNDKWNGLKKDSDWLSKVTKLRKTNVSQLKEKHSLLVFSYLPGPTLKKSNIAPDPDSFNTSIPIEFFPTSSQFDEPDDGLNIISPTPATVSNDSKNISSKITFKTSAQDEIRSRIGFLNANLVGLLTRQKNYLLTVDEAAELKRTEQEA
jgi:hypothetical protein